MKMARDGSWSMWYGMWISSFVLLPFGVFFTYKANKDSVVFNTEVYVEFIRNLLGIPSRRHIYKKEVIIDDPNYTSVVGRIQVLKSLCVDYCEKNNLKKAPSYLDIFFRSKIDTVVETIDEKLESIVEELSNSKDLKILQELNNLPIIFTSAHTSPSESMKWNKVLGILFPIGLLLWLRIWRFRLQLLRDLRQIEKSCTTLEILIQKIEH